MNIRNDLIKRLGRLADYWSLDFDANTDAQHLETARVLLDAADEIERLQGLDEIAQIVPVHAE